MELAKEDLKIRLERLMQKKLEPEILQQNLEEGFRDLFFKLKNMVAWLGSCEF